MISDQFEDIVRISEGATSVVYRARRPSDHRKVILKVLRGPHPPARHVEEFRKEYALAASLVGQNLIPPLGFIDDVEPAIVFEDLGGVATLQLVADGPLAVGEVLSIGADTARALVSLHAAGVIHRDVSPANIVRSPATGRAWLIDFGLATRRSRDVQAEQHRLHGTLAYISPEQTGRTNRTVDERSDLYSLAASLYHLLTGRPPFVAPDRVGLIHAQLARAAQPAGRIRPGTPACVDAVLQHALRKNPDERYQSATGLLADLERCARLIDAGDTASFEPGQNDRSTRLRLTEALVGRQAELAVLNSALGAASAGAVRLACVRGWSGIGKTRLVNELIPAVTSVRGNWIAGKHELLGRGVPYAGLAGAFGRWAGAVAADPAEAVSVRERLMEAVGAEGGALLAVIPELEQLIGPTAPVVPLPPADAERRIAVLFGALIGAIAQPGSPLVLFVDDLQWADTASLEVLRRIFTDPALRNVLVVLAWRDNEVSAGHPVLSFIDELGTSGTQAQWVDVGALSAQATAEFVARSLQMTVDEVRPLGAAIFGASGGSPFYAGRLLTSLHEDGGVLLGPGGWTWRLDSPVLAEAPDDAAAFMRARLLRMPFDARRALAASAWLGSTFRLKDVARALDSTLAQTAEWIEIAANIEAVARVDDSPVESTQLDEGLDDALLPVWRFAHDRVQQAAAELTAGTDQQQLRLSLARLLASLGSTREFEAVDHAIAAGSALSEVDERVAFARIGASAARDAVGAAAFDVAYRIFVAALGWVGQEGWTQQGELTLQLELGAAEAAYLNADRAQMELHVANVLSRSSDPLARLRAEEIASQALMAANELSTCIDRAVGAVVAAGTPIVPYPGIHNVVGGLIRTKVALRKVPHARLRALPVCGEPLVQARMRLTASLFSPAFYGRPLLFPILAFTLVRESVAHGATPETPIALCVYGIVLCTTGAVAEGIEYGKSALELNDRLHDRRLRHRTVHIWNAHLRFWFERWHVCRDDLKAIHRGCWEGGDVEYAAFAAFMSCTLGLHTGESLQELHTRNGRAIAAIRSLGQLTMLHTTLMHHQIVENLLGLSDDPTRLVGASYDEVEMEKVHGQANDRVNLHCLGVSRAFIAVFVGDLEVAAGAMRSVDRWDRDAKSQPIHHAGVFYDALAHAAIGDTGRARRKLRELRSFATIGAVNHAHRVAMVEAELHAQRDHTAEAVAAWERAVGLAETNGFPHERALALDRAAAYHLRQKHVALARMLLVEARSAYARWGAVARVQQIDDELLGAGRLLGASPGRRRPSLSTTSTSIAMSARLSGSHAATGLRSVAHTPATPSHTTPISSGSFSRVSSASDDAPIDLEALLGAGRRIAQEVEARRVTEALLEASLMLTGATDGALFRTHADGYVVALRAHTGDEGVEVESPDGAAIPSVLLDAALRAGVPVSGAPEHHASDPALAGRVVRSMVVVPLVHTGRTLGLLMVTHSALADAFPARRIAPLEALAAQAGIALENAVHYEELDARVRQRTDELVASRREAEAERDRADRILLNVLPEPIANELKKNGRAAPVSAPSATVLFTDFAGFTQLASVMSPEDLVAELERCFAAFDDIVDRYGVTKLKTIGDAYMAVGGLPVANNTHAFDVVRAGLDMAAWIDEPTDGRPRVPFKVRIGVHTGPLVAGVIGKRRFLYDVWGDTVNVAARMESSGEPGRVNISQQTWELVRDQVECTARGLVKAKGKGELEMFFVDRVKG